jgi:hypothetical protein
LVWSNRFDPSAYKGELEMSVLNVRKLVVTVEETLTEGGKEVTPRLRKAAVVAVIVNPFAGHYVEDLSPLFDVGGELGDLLGRRAVEALGVAPDRVQSYGKGAIVGTAGELEHCAALLHPKFGKPLRLAVGGGEAIIPSAKKRGGQGLLSTFPSIIRMMPGGSPTSTPWKCACPMRQGQTRSWWQWW